MKVHQFRCWPSQETTINSNWANMKVTEMFGKNILSTTQGTYTGITQIGIQGAPGTRFWLNNAQQSSHPEPLKGIVLNWTGIFEIDLSDTGGEINSIIFDPSSSNLYKGTEQLDGTNPDNYKLIVDILYNNGGVS